MEKGWWNSCSWWASHQGGKQTKIPISQGKNLDYLIFYLENTVIILPSILLLINSYFCLILCLQEADGASLVISLAEEKDAGKYVCQISTYKPTEIKHTVKIRGKKSKPYTQFSHNITHQK